MISLLKILKENDHDYKIDEIDALTAEFGGQTSVLIRKMKEGGYSDSAISQFLAKMTQEYSTIEKELVSATLPKFKTEQ